MRPIDFLLYAGDSEPNTPVYRIAEAMEQNMLIIGPNGLLTALSYYYDSCTGQMVLEVGEKAA
jgi:hypothetical protein